MNGSRPGPANRALRESGRTRGAGQIRAAATEAAEGSEAKAARSAPQRGYCLDCGKVQPLREQRIPTGHPPVPQATVGHECGKCGAEWTGEAQLVPSGYEWCCPGCGKENRQPGITADVTCAHCGGEFAVDLTVLDHCYD